MSRVRIIYFFFFFVTPFFFRSNFFFLSFQNSRITRFMSLLSQYRRYHRHHLVCIMDGYGDTNDRRVGLPRGPEVFGARVNDDKRDKLKNKIMEFERRIDKNNKEHVDMLERMRMETRELERLRGVWSERGIPGVSRDWNIQEPKTKTEAPKERTEYKEYIDFKEAERKRKTSGPDRHLIAKTTKQEDVDDVVFRSLPSTLSSSSSSSSSSLKSKPKE